MPCTSCRLLALGPVARPNASLPQLCGEPAVRRFLSADRRSRPPRRDHRRPRIHFLFSHGRAGLAFCFAHSSGTGRGTQFYCSPATVAVRAIQGDSAKIDQADRAPGPAWFRTIWQARLSHDYMLVVCRDTDRSWTVRVVGACPIQDRIHFISGIAEVQREAYSLARRHFFQKMIVEPAVPFNDLQWDAYLV